MDDTTQFPPQFQPTPFPASQAPQISSDSSVETAKPEKKKRGRRRTPVAADQPAAPRQPRQPRRAPPRRAATPKRPRRNTVRKPKRPKASLDIAALAPIFVGLQADDTAILADVVARLNDTTAGARQRILAAIGKVFGEMS